MSLSIRTQPCTVGFCIISCMCLNRKLFLLSRPMFPIQNINISDVDHFKKCFCFIPFS
jgi:hypothetical protein